MNEEKLIGKVLRCSAHCLAMKVTCIEEAHNMKNMRLDTLMGSLKTFEMKLNKNNQEKKIRSFGLKA